LVRTFNENDFDGYELEYVPMKAGGARRQTVRLEWSKPEAVVLRKSSVWRMELPLASERGHGEFRLYRAYSEKPLMFDINLLTLYFPGELTKALDRAVRDRLTEEQAMAAAVAGPRSSLPLFETQA
jgi:hypothetical protein